MQTDATQRVGEKSSPYAEEVPTDRLRAFASAVQARYVDGVAPATYMTTCRKGEFELFERLQVDLAQVLHVEQEYHYETPILGGDFLHYQTELVSVALKGKGKMLFLTFQTSVTIERAGSRPNQLPAGSAKSLILVRLAP